MSRHGVLEEPWQIAFLAAPEEVHALRREAAERLARWGLSAIADDVVLVVTELVANVIKHVGAGSPMSLAVSMRGDYLRLEAHDHDPRVLPVLLTATDEWESGRGMQLVDAIADRWGVIPTGDGKRIWCELETRKSRMSVPPVARAESLLLLYSYGHMSSSAADCRSSDAESVHLSATELIADVLQWLHIQGHDPRTVLERAQARWDMHRSG